MDKEKPKEKSKPKSKAAQILIEEAKRQAETKQNTRFNWLLRIAKGERK